MINALLICSGLNSINNKTPPTAGNSWLAASLTNGCDLVWKAANQQPQPKE
jgi:hypothetical protein